ncbi:Srd anti-sigma factor [Salmonella phage STML-198]|uniref:Anti-sigma factor n=2 Tax=Gelderlandvirus TaxID=1913653 RepID=K4I2M4_9CAUD|nr:Srd anti-sigma factor [Salmonella phage STML-198]YP_009615501.1 Srd anti-sigma factor [Salmonella phage Melville]AFU63968.1 hypothetical protein [Salmonella phage STML-198]ATN92989.1 activator of RNaseE [Salmonella phage Melville]UPW42389.1 hypothetical protein EBPHNEJP_00091 [Salmonella phage CF-SP2]
MAMPREIVIAQRLVHTYKSASSRSKEFNLSLKYLMNIMEQDTCAYSGEKFKKELGPDQMTLERFDNNKGYVEGNVIPVKMKYNKLRANFEIDDLIKKQEELAARIVSAVDSKNKVVEPAVDLNHSDFVLETHDWNKEPDWSKISDVRREEAKRIWANVQARRSHLKQAGIQKDTRDSLETRIKGGIKTLKRIFEKYPSSEAVTSGAASKKNSKAEITVKDYDIIIQGLTRFQNLSRLDKAKLKKGLPLSATLLQLIRGKM